MNKREIEAVAIVLSDGLVSRRFKTWFALARAAIRALDKERKRATRLNWERVFAPEKRRAKKGKKR